MIFLESQHLLASHLLNEIVPTLAGDVFVPDLTEVTANSLLLHHQIQQEQRRLQMDEKQISLLTPQDNPSHYHEAMTRFLKARTAQQRFSLLRPKQAIRFLSELNHSLDRAMKTDDGYIVGSSWRIRPYSRVSADGVVTDRDREIDEAALGFPLHYGGFFCVRDDGLFVRTALDLAQDRISLAAGRDGHYLEMSVLFWLDATQLEQSAINTDVSILVNQGYISTSRYSLSFDPKQISQFTGLDSSLMNLPVLNVSQDFNELLLLAAAQNIFHLQFSGAKHSMVEFSKPATTPDDSRRSGVAGQARVSARHILHQLRTGQEAVQPLSEANLYKDNTDRVKRIVLNLYRPHFADALMPVRDRLYEALDTQLGVRLFQ